MTDADLLTLIRNTPALKALADAGRDYDLAAAVPQYATKLTVPVAFTAQQIMGSVSAANRGAVAKSGMYLGIQSSIAAQDRTAAANEAQLCVDAGLITTAEQAAIMAVLNATQSVPDTSVDHTQVSRVLNAIRPVVDGAIRALAIAW